MPALRSLPLDQVDEPEATPRAVYDDPALMELADSIRNVGLLQPIGVVAAGDRYRRVFGKRRLLACRYLGRLTIDAVVLTLEESLEYEAASAENIQRRDMTPVEEARAVRHMLDARGKSTREVAAALGKSESWVRQRVEILLWPDDIVDLVGRRVLPVAVARELVLVESASARGHFLRCAVENGVTAQTMRLWRQEWEAGRAVAGPDVEESADGARLPAPALPSWPCAVCSEAHILTSLTYLRVCSPCALRLDEAKRELAH